MKLKIFITQDNYEDSDNDKSKISDADYETTEEEDTPYSDSDIFDEVTKTEVSKASKSQSDNTSSIIHLSKKVLYGRNDHMWTTEKQTADRIPIEVSGGPSDQCKDIIDPLKCFEMFITDEILNEIVQWTNVEIATKQKGPESSKNSHTNTLTDVCEIRALIGLLVLTAVLRDNLSNTDELFDISFSGTRYISTMSRSRFEFLLRCLKFDDRSLRTSQKEPKFAPFQIIWDLFMENCRNNFSCGTRVTIDDQLIPFRGVCPFRSYIPKTRKYGVKVAMMCDSETKYMVDAVPYLGKSTKSDVDKYLLEDLTRSIHGSQRNITAGSNITTVPLAKALLCKPYDLTIIGAIRSKEKEIPRELLNVRGRKLGTSLFCYDDLLTLLSFKSKSKKIIYLLSSGSDKGSIDEETNKPSMLKFYEQTKGAVETYHKMCSKMSCSRRTKNWTINLFYGILDMAFTNSYIIYFLNKININEKPNNRDIFMKELHTKLVCDYLKKRVDVPTLSKNLKSCIQELLPGTSNTKQTSKKIENPEALEPAKRKICAYCSYKKKRMTKVRCMQCFKNICGEHKVDLCVICAKDI